MANAFDLVAANEEQALIEELGRTVIYQPVAGGYLEIPALVDDSLEEREDATGEVGIIRRDWSICVRTSDVEPIDGDLVTMDGVDFVVEVVITDTVGTARLRLRALP